MRTGRRRGVDLPLVVADAMEPHRRSRLSRASIA
jgi:hypothetical protein